ncbi:MAG TPA: hypothetical protein VGO62_04410, partial [Myxococcota bacterium]
MSGVNDVASLTSAQSGAASSFSAAWTLTGQEPDGAVRVVVDAVDALGVPRSLPTDVVITIDTQPPHAVAVAVQRVPDPRLTPVAFEIQDETAVGPATAVRVIFATDEAVFVDGSADDVAAHPDLFVPAGDARAPSLTTDADPPLPFARDTSVASPLIFDVIWPSDVVGLDGDHHVVATLTDLFGNTSSETLQVDPAQGTGPLVLAVDATPPSPPSVDVADAVRFERAPWGRLDVPALDTFTVVGTAATERSSFIIITRDALGHAELGRTQADSDGNFEAASLPTGDLATVFVRAADRAGNVSDVVAVRDIAWFVTPLGKIVGDDVVNPHAFEDAGLFRNNLGQGGFIERGDADGIGAPDGTALHTVTGGTWRLVPPDDPQEPFQIVGASAANDPVRGVSLIQGGVNVATSFGAAGTADRGHCGDERGDVWLRGTDDRWRQRVTGPGELVPPPENGVVAFDPALDGLVLVQFGGETWLLRDGGWTQLCAQFECADADQFAAPSGLAWDPLRNVLVTTSSVFTLTFDGSAWTPAGDAVTGTAMTFDENLGRVVRFDGTTLWSWDGAAWSDGCVDAACLASAPPARPDGELAFDRARHQLVLFGGEADVPCSYSAAEDLVTSQGLAPQPTLPHNDTWIFDGHTWRDATPAVSPPGRVGEAMLWDEARHAVVVVGGDDCHCLGEAVGITTPFDPAIHGDTWEWDGAAWHEVGLRLPPDAGYTRAQPPAVRDHALAEDPVHDGVLLLGGSGDGTVDNHRLFVFHDDAWYGSTAASNDFDFGAALPASATADDGTIIIASIGEAHSGEIVPAGGPFHMRVNDNVTALACPDNPTVPLCEMQQGLWGASGFFLADRFWFFGGNQGALLLSPGTSIRGFAANGLVSWTPAEGWLSHCTGGECGDVPPARVMQGTAARTGDGRAVLMGGVAGDGTILDDTWIYDGATWSQVA